MLRPLIHGVYDSLTLQTLLKLGVKEFSFDLRGKSSNLIPLKELKLFTEQLKNHQLFLCFENDKKEIVLSFLDLLKHDSSNWNLLFRGTESADFFKQLNKDFYWMFHPESDWKSFLKLKNIKGIFLPVVFQDFYQNKTELWQMIEENNLDVYLHANTFTEALKMNLSHEVKLSIDLGVEVEKSYRMVDQDKLFGLKIWSMVNENSSF